MNTAKQIQIEEIIHTHTTGRGDCSDSVVLKRYYEAVCQHRLSPDALLYYGMLIDPTKGETKYLLAFAAALDRVKDLVDDIDDKLRLRSGMKAEHLLDHAKEVNIRLSSAQQEIAARLKLAIPLPTELPFRIAEMLRKLSTAPVCA